MTWKVRLFVLVTTVVGLLALALAAGADFVD
jgi:hypothetical protein